MVWQALIVEIKDSRASYRNSKDKVDNSTPVTFDGIKDNPSRRVPGTDITETSNSPFTGQILSIVCIYVPLR